jgi:hypothetical protein
MRHGIRSKSGKAVIHGRRSKKTCPQRVADEELMRWMPPPDGIECAKVVLLEPR